MMDILFLHVPKFQAYSKTKGWFSFINYPPVGLFGLADYLRQNGFQSQIVHLGVERHKYGKIDFARLIGEKRPAMVGLDLHWHPQSYDVIETARAIKRSCPDIPIVLGGYTASIFAEELLRDYGCIDYVIRGEGEVPLRELISAIRSRSELSRVSNLAFRENGTVRMNPMAYVADEEMLNSLNFTDFSLVKDSADLMEFSRYARMNGLSDATYALLGGGRKMFPVVAGRGCPYRCLFCGGSSEAQKVVSCRNKVAQRSAESVLDSIEDVVRFGFNHVLLNHDSFLDGALAVAFYRDLFAGVRQRKLALSCELERWRFLPTRELARDFRETFAEGAFISLSLWSHDPKVRKQNGLHWYSNEQLETCLRVLDEEGVNCRIYFSCGLLAEGGREGLLAMARYQRELKSRFPRVECQTYILDIEPGSSISRNYQELGVVPARTTFADYYGHNRPAKLNSCTQLGCQRPHELGEKELGRLYCRHFCNSFHPAWAAPLMCAGMGLLWKSGTMRCADLLLGVVSGLRSKRSREIAQPQAVPAVAPPPRAARNDQHANPCDLSELPGEDISSWEQRPPV